jgi:hypothetical protein
MTEVLMSRVLVARSRQPAIFLAILRATWLGCRIVPGKSTSAKQFLGDSVIEVLWREKTDAGAKTFGAADYITATRLAVFGNKA